MLCCAAVLQGLDLILPKGTITAVVGRSGAGKSTVASLLSRFYEPDSGAIWLGGKPAADFTRGEWAKAVALVSQEPVLFSGQSEVSRWLIISAQCALKTESSRVKYMTYLNKLPGKPVSSDITKATC